MLPVSMIKQSYNIIYLLLPETTAPVLLADYITTGNGLKNGVHCRL